MNLLRLAPPPILVLPSASHGFPTHHRLRFKSISYASLSSSSPGGQWEQPPPAPSRIPARDRVIDFGKHRGKMLGTLPSSYLVWVSKNFRAGDYEEWARIADEVLRDPVYQDRLEWEAAERVLTGVGHRASSSSPTESPAEVLLGISQSFGWDNEDKEGWRRVNFQLLGTSKGGRIPRLPKGNVSLRGQTGRTDGGVSKVGFLGMESSIQRRREVMGTSRKTGRLERNNEPRCSRKSLESQFHPDAKPRVTATGGNNSSIRRYGSSVKPVFTDKDCWVHEARKAGTLSGSKVGYLSNGFRFTVGEEEEEESSMEEAVKHKREERRERQRSKREQQMRTLRREVGVEEGGGDRAVARGRIGEENCGYSNPFPGRRALLDKIRGRDALL